MCVVCVKIRAGWFCVSVMCVEISRAGEIVIPHVIRSCFVTFVYIVFEPDGMQVECSKTVALLVMFSQPVSAVLFCSTKQFPLTPHCMAS